MKKIAKGFTLVELMIVVAIIGILAAIAIPNFMKYQLRAKYGELPTNINGWFKAEESLRQAERTIPTAAGGDGVTTGQYFVFTNALPAGCGVGTNPTSKKQWATTDISAGAAIDWVVEGSTYACYQAAIDSGVACGTGGTCGNNVLLEAGADIDGDGNAVSVVLFKPVLAADGTPTPATLAAPISTMTVGEPFSTIQRWDVTNSTNVGTDNVF